MARGDAGKKRAKPRRLVLQTGTMNEDAARKETLPNGLVVLTEAMPQVRTAAVGIWVQTGSRAEPAELNGISHFIEHMVFKGTARRTAEQIAREADALGGHLDAFTAKEYVCFNIKVLDENLPEAFDILADLAREPLFRQSDIEKERNVILEEIKMDEDNPDYLVHELFTQNFWREHALGRPILGRPESLARLDHEVVSEFFRRNYAPNQMIVSAAGRLEPARVADLAAQAFGALPRREGGATEAAPAPAANVTLRQKRELEQIHLCVGAPCYPLAHEKRFAVSLLNNILGGGMSSRLFQNVREREGLAYAVFSDAQAYRDTGCLTVYAGTSPGTARPTLALILAEFRRLKAEPVPADELARAKRYLKASLMFSLESTTSRMSNLARQEIYFGRTFTPDETLAAIERVTAEDIRQAAAEFFQPGRVGATALGQLEGFQLQLEELAC
jgi:predicted Zn-dependent peptidase